MNDRPNHLDTDSTSPTASRPWRTKTRKLAMGGTLLVAGLIAAACGSSSTSTASAPTTAASAATTAPASSSTAKATASSSMGTVHVASVGSLGSVLVNASGRTLYMYTPDKQKMVSCTGACAHAWPPLDVSGGKPVAGTGLTASLLGTIKAPGGKTQVTYNHWPLYTFDGDSAAGQSHGEGLEGTWFALTASGAEDKGGAAKPTTTTKPASTTPATTAPASSSVGY